MSWEFQWYWHKVQMYGYLWRKFEKKMRGKHELHYVEYWSKIGSGKSIKMWMNMPENEILLYKLTLLNNFCFMKKIDLYGKMLTLCSPQVYPFSKRTMKITNVIYKINRNFYQKVLVLWPTFIFNFTYWEGFSSHFKVVLLLKHVSISPNLPYTYLPAWNCRIGHTSPL